VREQDMKFVHTSYIITSLIFVIIAANLVSKQPEAVKEEEINTKIQSSEAVHHDIQAGQASTEDLGIVKAVDNETKEVVYKYPKVNVVATGYYAGIESTGKDITHPQYGITYSGVKVRRDHYSTIAADLNLFPLGTILYIPGYGYGVVSDIGSAIQGNIIDLYFETIDEVYSEWGKKEVEVYVVKEGDGNVTETMLNELNDEKFVQANTEFQEYK
jgi:3D (Asp-Asp-Asp) domain-containing protein